MSFKFNFAVGGDSAAAAVGGGPGQPAAAAELRPCVEVFPDEAQASREAEVEEHRVSELIILAKGRLESSDASRLLGLDELAVADLIPGQYEGGFKLWEGSDDLVRCLCLEWGLQRSPLDSDFEPPPECSGKRVLELGCGHGLPGVFAALAGAAEVCFADFNAEVLQHLTAPNLRANLLRANLGRPPQGQCSPAVRYFSGDWLRVAEALRSEAPFDIILTSETVYSPVDSTRLLQALELLVPEGHAATKVYVAAKSYYFGVGGGAQQFRQLATGTGKFSCEGVYAVEDGASNKREVLILQRLP